MDDIAAILDRAQHVAWVLDQVAKLDEARP